jgi:poly(A)-specific ribonuclease
MEITSENYWESLPGVLEAMAAATYVSVDVEMTGLYSKNTTTNAKTALNAIYEQAKEASERFQIVQFGLSCISYHKSTKGKSV